MASAPFTVIVAADVASSAFQRAADECYEYATSDGKRVKLTRDQIKHIVQHYLTPELEQLLVSEINDGPWIDRAVYDYFEKEC
jgi:hypothetical protein